MWRFRVLFALIGGAACLLTALLLEMVLQTRPVANLLASSMWPLLIYRSDISRRVEQAGGQSGEVQISLSWNNRNDLDLWCVDPSGVRIWFMHRRSPTGGQLDVDANASVEHLTSTPVENIFWPYGEAPLGTYRVFVHYYANHGDPDPTAFRCRVMVRGNIKQYQGSLWPHQTVEVTDFTVRPATTTPVTALSNFLLEEFVIVGLWVGLIVGLMALAFLGGLWWVYRRQGVPFLFTRLQLLLRAGRMAGWGFLAGGCGQLVFHLLLWGGVRAGMGMPPLWENFGRYVGWLVVGLLVGVKCSRWIPHWPLRATRNAGGLAGLLAAWCLNDALRVGSDAMGRLLAATLVGALIGLMVLLVFAEEALPEEPVQEVALPVLEPMRLRPQRAHGVGVVRTVPPKMKAPR
ncbi:YfaP family protein [Chthonomonas calidirosea]|uniref:YfaP family protein n=1 Tax=Chthonomonas calidirosea TaxID=454171 RepID=UPI0006ECA753|nr:hypothetical protein [Chthonomonas calidirosea]CEK12689.1 hypothetical protein CP488_00152 [Chthonomonas calidirosea]